LLGDLNPERVCRFRQRSQLFCLCLSGGDSPDPIPQRCRVFVDPAAHHSMVRDEDLSGRPAARARGGSLLATKNERVHGRVHGEESSGRAFSTTWKTITVRLTECYEIFHSQAKQSTWAYVLRTTGYILCSETSHSHVSSLEGFLSSLVASSI
jgi:hypothetical protein